MRQTHFSALILKANYQRLFIGTLKNTIRTFYSPPEHPCDRAHGIFIPPPPSSAMRGTTATFSTVSFHKYKWAFDSCQYRELVPKRNSESLSKAFRTCSALKTSLTYPRR